MLELKKRIITGIHPKVSRDIGNWQTFWGRPGLIRRDGIHLWEGAALISRNMTRFISQPNEQFRVEVRNRSCLTYFSTYNPIETVSVPRPHKFTKFTKSNSKSSYKNLIKVNTANEDV